MNLDNGPEYHIRRAQFMLRLVEFASKHQVTIQLAYYPPYHSKYNPIERCWDALENYWNGSLMDSIKAVLVSTNSTIGCLPFQVIALAYPSTALTLSIKLPFQ